MLINYVWPFRQLPDSQERKTFFWLECNYEEAIEVLHQAKLSVEDFRNYVDLLHRFREENHADRDLGEGLDVYSRIGFLISEDGKNVEWAPSGFPISSLWNAYNPFKGIHTIKASSFTEFNEMAKRFAKDAPYYSNLNDKSQITERFRLERFRGANPDSFLNELVQSSELAKTAIQIFFARYCKGATIGELEYFNDDCVVQWELAHLYQDLPQSTAQQSTQNQSASNIDFSQITLLEIYARKRRAIANLRKLESKIAGEGVAASGSPLGELKALSDDEICELALLMERYTWSPAIKWIYGEFIDRLQEMPLFDVRPPCPERPRRRLEERDAVVQVLDPLI